MAPKLINTKYRDIDSKIQLGYKYLYENENTKTIETWIVAWNEILDEMESNSIKSFIMFDRILQGTQYISNWVNDFDDCLLNIVANSNISENLEVYGNIRIQLNEQILCFTEKDDELSIENAKRAIAETHFFMGNVKKGEELFENYLMVRPDWGWGWIAWSDQYWLFKGNSRQYQRGEELLLKGLSVPDLKDRDMVEERLLELYRESESDKFKEFEKILKSKKQSESTGVKSNNNLLNQAVSEKIGRNDPCPCGSSKKYKKCCSKA